jgi:hypothetical protein
LERGFWRFILTLAHDDILYTISAVVNLSSVTSKTALTKESLLAMAENLTDDLSAQQSVIPVISITLRMLNAWLGLRFSYQLHSQRVINSIFATIEDGTGLSAYNTRTMALLILHCSYVKVLLRVN